VPTDQRPGAPHRLGPPPALHHQRLDTDRQPHANIDARNDEHDEPRHGGQPDQHAHQQDRPEPHEPEAIALLNVVVSSSHLGSDRPGDRPRKHLVQQQSDERGQQRGCRRRPERGRDHLVPGEWADRELNGYRDDAPLPPYRATRPARVLGSFSGPFGLMADDIQIAEPYLDPKLRARSRELKLFEISFSSPVAAYEELLRGDDDDDFQIPWPAGTAQFTHAFQDMTCVSVGKRVSRGELVAVLDGVRNRLLSLVLDLEREAPEAGDVPSSTLPIPEEQIARLVQINLYAGGSSVTDNSIRVHGTAGNIAGGQGNLVRQGDISITQEGVDLGALLEILRATVEQLDGQLPPVQRSRRNRCGIG
jgi:hypothetical protein